MIVDLIATQGRLVVKKLDHEQKTKKGLIISDQNPDVHFGEVINVGDPLDEKVTQRFEQGQVVAWQNYSGVEYSFQGEQFVVLNQKDIIAIRETEVNN